MIGEALSEEILGLDSPEKRMEIIKTIKKSEIVKVFKKINIDTVFLLEGVKNEED
jgi:hypothetical protein